MNRQNCPFDGGFCESKHIYAEELKTFAFRNPELVVPYKNNFFAGCPIRNEIERKETVCQIPGCTEICKRYFEYCLKITNEKQHEDFGWKNCCLSGCAR